MSTVLDEVLAANATYAGAFGAKKDLALPPARRFAILTCMDARLDPAKFAADFGAELPKAQAEFMARSQMPVSAAAFNAKLTAAAGHMERAIGSLDNDKLAEAYDPAQVDALVLQVLDQLVDEDRLVADGWGTLVGYDYELGRSVELSDEIRRRVVPNPA